MPTSLLVPAASRRGSTSSGDLPASSSPLPPSPLIGAHRIINPLASLNSAAGDVNNNNAVRPAVVFPPPEVPSQVPVPVPRRAPVDGCFKRCLGALQRLLLSFFQFWLFAAITPTDNFSQRYRKIAAGVITLAAGCYLHTFLPLFLYPNLIGPWIVVFGCTLPVLISAGCSFWYIRWTQTCPDGVFFSMTMVPLLARIPWVLTQDTVEDYAVVFAYLLVALGGHDGCRSSSSSRSSGRSGGGGGAEESGIRGGLSDTSTRWSWLPRVRRHTLHHLILAVDILIGCIVLLLNTAVINHWGGVGGVAAFVTPATVDPVWFQHLPYIFCARLPYPITIAFVMVIFHQLYIVMDQAQAAVKLTKMVAWKLKRYDTDGIRVLLDRAVGVRSARGRQPSQQQPQPAAAEYQPSPERNVEESEDDDGSRHHVSTGSISSGSEKDDDRNTTSRDDGGEEEVPVPPGGSVSRGHTAVECPMEPIGATSNVTTAPRRRRCRHRRQSAAVTGWGQDRVAPELVRAFEGIVVSLETCRSHLPNYLQPILSQRDDESAVGPVSVRVHHSAIDSVVGDHDRPRPHRYDVMFERDVDLLGDSLESSGRRPSDAPFLAGRPSTHAHAAVATPPTTNTSQSDLRPTANLLPPVGTHLPPPTMSSPRAPMMAPPTVAVIPPPGAPSPHAAPRKEKKKNSATREISSLMKFSQQPQQQQQQPCFIISDSDSERGEDSAGLDGSRRSRRSNNSSSVSWVPSLGYSLGASASAADIRTLSSKVIRCKVTACIVVFRWIPGMSLSVMYYRLLIGVIHEVAQSTEAAIHGLIGDRLVVTWNATKPVAGHALRGCQFPLRLKQRIESTKLLKNALTFSSMTSSREASNCFAGDDRMRQFVCSSETLWELLHVGIHRLRGIPQGGIGATGGGGVCGVDAATVTEMKAHAQHQQQLQQQTDAIIVRGLTMLDLPEGTSRVPVYQLMYERTAQEVDGGPAPSIAATTAVAPSAQPALTALPPMTVVGGTAAAAGPPHKQPLKHVLPPTTPTGSNKSSLAASNEPTTVINDAFQSYLGGRPMEGVLRLQALMSENASVQKDPCVISLFEEMSRAGHHHLLPPRARSASPQIPSPPQPAVVIATGATVGMAGSSREVNSLSGSTVFPAAKMYNCSASCSPAAALSLQPIVPFVPLTPPLGSGGFGAVAVPGMTTAWSSGANTPQMGPSGGSQSGQQDPSATHSLHHSQGSLPGVDLTEVSSTTIRGGAFDTMTIATDDAASAGGAGGPGSHTSMPFAPLWYASQQQQQSATAALQQQQQQQLVQESTLSFRFSRGCGHLPAAGVDSNSSPTLTSSNEGGLSTTLPSSSIHSLGAVMTTTTPQPQPPSAVSPHHNPLQPFPAESPLGGPLPTPIDVASQPVSGSSHGSNSSGTNASVRMMIVANSPTAVFPLPPPPGTAFDPWDAAN